MGNNDGDEHTICIENLENIINDIFSKNADSSAVFINNLQCLYRLSKEDFVSKFKTRDVKTVFLLREQLYYIFLDHFSEETLVLNGFIITDDPKHHLRKRFKNINAIIDIYNMGLSILENKIVLKLDSEIYKQNSNNNSSTDQTKTYQNIIDTNSKELIDKISELTKIVTTIQTENQHLKKQLEKMEKKMDIIISKASSQNQKSTPVDHEAFSSPNNSQLYSSALSRQQISSPTLLQKQKSPSAPSRPLQTSPMPSTSTNQSPAPKLNDHPSKQQQKSNSHSPPPSPNPNADYSSLQLSKTDSHQKYDKPTQSQPSKKPIFGKGKANNKISGETKPFSLFVGGLNINLNENDVKEYIEKDIGLKVINLESNKVNKYNQSYRVDIKITDKEKALDGSSWCQGLIVKPFKIPKYRQPDTHQRYDYNFYDEIEQNDYYNNYEGHNPRKTLDNRNGSNYGGWR